MAGFLARLQQAAPTEAWDGLDDGAGERLERFAEVSPLYAGMIEQTPALACWLENPETRQAPLGLDTLLAAVEHARASDGPLERGSPEYPGFLRRFRRRMSLRIAYRDVAGFASPALVVEELTRLAEMMIRECLFVASDRAQSRWGTPWDEELDAPARFTLLGLGKLGGRELNFSSDIDLIYLYEGEGHTRRGERATSLTNGEYFEKMATDITQLLSARDGDGFMFRVDLRLRPGGSGAALVPSLQAAENYYAATAQSWERLALLKARVVAGDFVSGGEFLENLHSFRYPRHPPASLLSDVAAMKQRTENEVVGAGALSRDIKSGLGGIREIEFFTQVLQLLHAARFPFLQTGSTTEALRQLTRYELLTPDDAQGLTEDYWFLRQVEHRLQMAEEHQTHELPDDPDRLDRLARSLHFSGADALNARLDAVRARVRRHYSDLFASTDAPVADQADPWWPFFAEDRSTPMVEARLNAWFGRAPDAEAARSLRLFVRGEETWPLVREQVQRFAALAPALDHVMPRLARPQETLRRISTFAERYATRNQFLAACTMNRDFFEVLALLFDRSRFIAELVTRHPEIFDEVLRPEILRKHKDVAVRRNEIAAQTAAGGTDFGAWLSLYVRAEQVRAAIGHLLGFVPDDGIGEQLTGIAEATLLELLARTPGASDVLVIALGTFGGRELSFGSDLDLLLICREDSPGAERVVRALQRALKGRPPEPTFVLDLRLRPHGDAGLLVPTLDAYREYFESSAQAWERLALTRTRVIAGPEDLVDEWNTWLCAALYQHRLTPEEADELWRMRLRIQRERDVTDPPERAFKAGAGGLVDVEFAQQILQLHHGSEHPEIICPNTREGWTAMARAGVIDPVLIAEILNHHRRLQQLEWCLRRDVNRAVSVIPEAPEDQQTLAHWLGAPDWPTFWAEHRQRLGQTRHAVIRALTGVVHSTTLETGR